jgi:hypothetical protein
LKRPLSPPKKPASLRRQRTNQSKFGKPIQRKYYLDESGNTGDLANAATLNFGDQPYFALACIGLSDHTRFEAEFQHLRSNYGIRSREIKSSILKSKPQFGLDLVRLLLAQEASVFIEAVDKTFYICANIVTSLLMPALGNDLSPANAARLNAFADLLQMCLPKELIHGYAVFCRTQSKSTLVALLRDFRSWIEELPPTSLTIQLMMIVELNLGTAQRISSDNDLARYLPFPSISKTNKAIWMLPHSTSLTSIYARINKFHRGKVADLTLVHDEQLQFDTVLHQMKVDTDAFGTSADAPRLAHADYRFSQAGTLCFASSATNLGIQATDVIAGLVVRYIGLSLSGMAQSNEVLASAFRDLTALPPPLGVNFVVSNSDHARILGY